MTNSVWVLWRLEAATKSEVRQTSGRILRFFASSSRGSGESVGRHSPKFRDWSPSLRRLSTSERTSLLDSSSSNSAAMVSNSFSHSRSDIPGLSALILICSASSSDGGKSRIRMSLIWRLIAARSRDGVLGVYRAPLLSFGGSLSESPPPGANPLHPPPRRPPPEPLPLPSLSVGVLALLVMESLMWAGHWRSNVLRLIRRIFFQQLSSPPR